MKELDENNAKYQETLPFPFPGKENFQYADGGGSK